MGYQDVALWSQMIAMAIFAIVMGGVLVYALRPGNKARFDAASRVPLADDGDKMGEPHGRS